MNLIYEFEASYENTCYKPQRLLSTSASCLKVSPYTLERVGLSDLGHGYISKSQPTESKRRDAKGICWVLINMVT